MDHKKALTGCESGDVVILLAHQPNAAQIVLNDEAKPSHIDLILSGSLPSLFFSSQGFLRMMRKKCARIVAVDMKQRKWRLLVMVAGS